MSTSAASIVLVHGAFVDGSGWAGVHRILRSHGFEVIIGATMRALPGSHALYIANPQAVAALIEEAAAIAS